MPSARETLRRVGRYALFGEIASGGMATVHFGRLEGGAGFSRTVAVKRLHPHLAKDANFVAMFVDEARLAARVRHPNTVPTLDVVEEDEEIFLVMEYVEGESLARLLKEAKARGEKIPLPIVASIMVGALSGLHAAHEAKDELGKPLGIVHRDVSPQNVLVGRDGITRVLDFGVAKARGRMQRATETGAVKGKLEYLAREQLKGEATRATDVFAASLVLWEMLTMRRHFQADNEAELVLKVVAAEMERPSRYADVPAALEEIVMRGLEPDPDDRYATTREMADAIEALIPLASPSAVGAWVERLAAEALAKRAASIAKLERAVRSASAAALEEEPDTARVSAPPRASATPPSMSGPREALSLPNADLGTDVSAITQPASPTAPMWTRGVTALVLVAAAGAIVFFSLRHRRSEDIGPTIVLAQSVRSSAAASPSASQSTPGAVDPSPTAVSWESLPAPAIAISALPDATPKPGAQPPPNPCNPPFVIVDGIKKYKRECLKRGGGADDHVDGAGF